MPENKNSQSETKSEQTESKNLMQLLLKEALSNNQRTILKSEWEDWKNHPATRQFMRRLASYGLELMELWGCTDPEHVSDVVDRKNVVALSQLTLVREILEQSFDDFAMTGDQYE